MNVLYNQADRSAHDTVRDYWQTQHHGADFDDFWQTSLHDGLMAGQRLAEKIPPDGEVRRRPSPAAASALEIVFRPDPSIGDGSLSNNAWLQEMPKPQNKMTWDNAVWISPKIGGALRRHHRRRDRNFVGGP